jgi:hypothetical protein
VHKPAQLKEQGYRGLAAEEAGAVAAGAKGEVALLLFLAPHTVVATVIVVDVVESIHSFNALVRSGGTTGG